jgi:hypothetical protein
MRTWQVSDSDVIAVQRGYTLQKDDQRNRTPDIRFHDRRHTVAALFLSWD